jgi:EAL domain-containing protein (putative c-di-GMP-specific phosphodiesterase class I)
VDILKIDRSFVSQLETDANSARITAAIVAMAQTLSLEIVAEGVETREQLSTLRDSNVNHVQGYLFSKPVAEDEFISLLSSGKFFEIGNLKKLTG